MRPVKKIVIALTIFLNLTPALGQEDLEIFGYFQTHLNYLKETTTLSNDDFGLRLEDESERKSFSVQQTNIFLRKELSVQWTAWLNLEFTNSFSSDEGWGTVNLEEAWLRYRHSNKFHLKAGLLIPRFNNLNEVKNRMPYLPYIFRPLIYEASLSEVFRQQDYVPERAYLQTYGELPVTPNWMFDYAVFLGNAEADFHNNDPAQQIQTGVDTTMVFLVGTRVGLKTTDFKAGVSFTLDKDNLARAGLGEVRRVRIGSDLSFSITRFSFESEIILIRYEDVASARDLDKRFFYATVLYDLDDHLFGYLAYNHVQDDFDPTIEDGLTAISVGGGYRLVEPILIKAQYVKVLSDGRVPTSETSPIPLALEFDIDTITAGVSIIF